MDSWIVLLTDRFAEPAEIYVLTVCPHGSKDGRRYEAGEKLSKAAIWSDRTEAERVAGAFVSASPRVSDDRPFLTEGRSWVATLAHYEPSGSGWTAVERSGRRYAP